MSHSRNPGSAELEVAIARDSTKGVIRILQRRCDLMLNKAPTYSTVLHLAALYGHAGCTRYLLSKPCFFNQINAQDENGYTPLMNAVLESYFDIAKLFIDTDKCDLSLTTMENENILHCAAQTKSKSTPKWLTIEAIKHGVNIEGQNVVGMTPFAEAVKHYNTNLAYQLHEVGCNINSACREGLTALHYAVRHGYEELVDWLVDVGAEVNTQTLTHHTPLMMCAQLHRPPHQVFLIIKSLLDKKADPNIQDSCGNTCLLLAVANGFGIRRHHIEFLLVSGADPDIPNCHGLTPIWHAVYTGCIPDRMQIIQLLIRENCNLDTPCRGQLLFRLGSSAVYCYETCLTPLEVALDSCLYDVAKVLVLSGCKVKDDLRYEIANSAAPQELQELRYYLDSPPDLQHICQLRVRRLLHKSLPQKVRRLPIPEKLKQQILLENVLKELDGKRI